MNIAKVMEESGDVMEIETIFAMAPIFGLKLRNNYDTKVAVSDSVNCKGEGGIGGLRTKFVTSLGTTGLIFPILFWEEISA